MTKNSPTDTNSAQSTGGLRLLSEEELAAKIANDINEGIDGGETRKMLREAIKFWAMKASITASELALAKTEMTVLKLQKELGVPWKGTDKTEEQS